MNKNTFLLFIFLLLFLASCSIEPHTQVPTSDTLVVLSGSTQTGGFEKTIDLTQTTQSGSLSFSGTLSQSGTLSISGSLTLSGAESLSGGTQTATGEIENELSPQERILLKLNDTIVAQTQKAQNNRLSLTQGDYQVSLMPSETGSVLNVTLSGKNHKIPLALADGGKFEYFQSFSPKGKYLLYDIKTASGNTISKLVDVVDGNVVFSSHHSSVSASAWTSDEKTFLYGFSETQGGEVGLYLVQSKAFPQKTQLFKDEAILSLFLEDGKIYALGETLTYGDYQMYTIDLNTEQIIDQKAVKQIDSRFEF